MAIIATWKHDNGYKFNTYYRTRGGFLRAYTKSRNSILDHAVDDAKCIVIRKNNIEIYRRMK